MNESMEWNVIDEVIWFHINLMMVGYSLRYSSSNHFIKVILF